MSNVDTHPATQKIAEPQQRMTKGEMLAPEAIETLQQRGLIRGDVPINVGSGAMSLDEMETVMNFAKMMATGAVGLKAHLRGQPGVCLRIVVQAKNWRLDPYFLADDSFVVNDTLAYGSKSIHSIVEKWAPLEGRLRFTFEGEGDKRVCVVTGRMMGEEAPFIWRSPEIGKIHPKNSPEWKNNPDKQLIYHTSRDWARIYCPDVLGNAYAADEIGEEYGAYRSRQIASSETGNSLADRLPKDESGFDSDGIATQLRSTVGAPAEPAEKPAAAAQEDAAEKPATHEAPAQPTDPTNEAEYTAYAEGWFERMPNREEAMARWDGEKETRAACRMSIKGRKALEKVLATKFPVQS